MTNKASHIKIDDVQAGRMTETVIDYDPIGDLQERIYESAVKHGKLQNLREAFVLTPDAGNLLRDGIRYMAFTAFTEMPQTFKGFTQIIPSNRPQEEYLRDAIMGTLPKVRSGQEAPRIGSNFEGGVTLANERYAGIVEVTGDDIRFDRLGKIRQIAPELGRAARMTEEYAAYAAITTTSNYVRNSTTGDNDLGANTQTLTFSGLALEDAYTIITTAKDRKSGSYLGLMPDTFICGPRLKWGATQLLFADQLMRGGATNEVRGTGPTPLYRGMITNMIVSPWFGSSYQWALVDSKRMSFVFQQVEPFNIYQEDQNASSEAWLTREVTRYLVQGYFGLGFVDDRPWFYSDSTSAPTVS